MPLQPAPLPSSLHTCVAVLPAGVRMHAHLRARVRVACLRVGVFIIIFLVPALLNLFFVLLTQSPCCRLIFYLFLSLSLLSSVYGFWLECLF